ncbi:tripartite tricarboxylate transporter TctB family protein [uncultured Desulfovibrio sp.]|uniref:tripartite tricarboxylate transporter TctB family protein n=1 Tax=uncultured Desulfovibrio sp. TaxID=167968 RepID=UPI0026732CDB|nr:tripartite tricarboxylate transporter TctB family protein [uncultured Desulfovibrio sp.]
MHIRKRSDCILAVLLFLGAVFFYYETYQIREVFSYSFGPRVFPRIILGLTALLAACLFVQSLGTVPVAHCAEEAKDPRASRQGLWLRGGVVALLLAYLLVLPWAGYLAATIPFLFCSMLFLGPRAPKNIVTYAVLSTGMSLLLKFIFGNLLKFFLP